MKSVNANMTALLATNGPFFVADCYTISNGNITARWTDCDRPVRLGSLVQTLYNVGPILSRSKTRTVLGLETSTMTVKLTAGPEILWNGIPIIKAIRQGQLDGASINVQKCIAASYETIRSGGANAILMFIGIVADVDIVDLTATLNVVSRAYLFDEQLPRNSYSPSCIRTLYDVGCTVNKNAVSVNGTVTSSPDNTHFNSALGQAADYFALGTVQFTSGANSGLTRTVRSFSGGTFSVSLPLPVQPSAGDTFTASPGCDKQKSTCSGKFSNESNFRGYPYVPSPESVA